MPGPNGTGPVGDLSRFDPRRNNRPNYRAGEPLDPSLDPFVAAGAPEWMYYQGGTPGNPTGIPTNDVTLPDGRTVPMSSPEAAAAYGTVPVPGLPDGWFQVTGQPTSQVRRQPAAEPMTATQQWSNELEALAALYGSGLTPQQQALIDQMSAQMTGNVYQPSAANQQRLNSALGQLLSNTQGASAGIDAAFQQGIAQVDAATAAAQQQADATAAQLGNLYAAGLGNIAAGVQGASQNAGQAIGMEGLALAPSTAQDLAGLMVTGSARDQAMAQNLGDVFAGAQGLISSGMSAEQAAQQSALARAAQAQEAQFRRDYMTLESARQEAVASENRQADREIQMLQLQLMADNQARSEDLMMRSWELQFGPQAESDAAIASMIAEQKAVDAYNAANPSSTGPNYALPQPVSTAISSVGALNLPSTDGTGVVSYPADQVRSAVFAAWNAAVEAQANAASLTGLDPALAATSAYVTAIASVLGSDGYQRFIEANPDLAPNKLFSSSTNGG